MMLEGAQSSSEQVPAYVGQTWKGATVLLQGAEGTGWVTGFFLL